VFIDDRQVHFPVAFVIQSLANQSRTIVNYRDLPGYSADQLIERLKAANNSPFNWIHFEGNYMTATHQSIEYLRHSIDDIIISVEIEKPQREGIELLIGKGDVVFFSRSYAMAHGFDEPVQFLASEFLCSRLRPTALAFVTWGDKGAAVRCPQNSGRDACYYRCLAYQVAIDGVVETTGAGDTFIAAIIQSNFLFDLRADPARCLAFGCYIAGLKCCQVRLITTTTTTTIYYEL
jgi:ketohexokinase